MIADETTEKFNACLNAKQEVKEACLKIEEKLKPYTEFLSVMKDTVKLANYEDNQPQNPMIHEDWEEMSQLTSQFEVSYEKAQKEATEFKLHELI